MDRDRLRPARQLFALEPADAQLALQLLVPASDTGGDRESYVLLPVIPS
jgi:hypothetical protein